MGKPIAVYYYSEVKRFVKSCLFLMSFQYISILLHHHYVGTCKWCISYYCFLGRI